MSALDKDYAVLRELERLTSEATVHDANVLRRAEMTLHRWAEGECGEINDVASWLIERDETGRPWRTFHYRSGQTHSERIPDREKGALKRVEAVCERLGLHYFHQGDPRGCALWVSTSPLTSSSYTDGVAICGR